MEDFKKNCGPMGVAPESCDVCEYNNGQKRGYPCGQQVCWYSCDVCWYNNRNDDGHRNDRLPLNRDCAR